MQEKQNQIIPFDYGDNLIRVIEDEKTGEPLWVAKDICEILEYKEVSKTLSKLDDDEKLIRKFFVSGQNREMMCLNESGLYTLILRSNKPEAKKFKKWVTSEVLPTIRKTKQYNLENIQKPLEENIYKNKYFELLERENKMLRDIVSNNPNLFIEPKRQGTKFSNSELETLRKMTKEGYSVREIARVLNRSTTGVWNIQKKENL